VPTIDKYKRAIELAPEFSKSELVVMKRGGMLTRHEPSISISTDVGDRAGFRKWEVTNVADCVSETDGFASDFAPAEIKALSPRQVFAARDQSLNDK
jgi:glycerophosphoryl diester phosphodiesterase